MPKQNEISSDSACSPKCEVCKLPFCPAETCKEGQWIGEERLGCIMSMPVCHGHPTPAPCKDCGGTGQVKGVPCSEHEDFYYARIGCKKCKGGYPCPSCQPKGEEKFAIGQNPVVVEALSPPKQEKWEWSECQKAFLKMWDDDIRIHLHNNSSTYAWKVYDFIRYWFLNREAALITKVADEAYERGAEEASDHGLKQEKFNVEAAHASGLAKGRAEKDALRTVLANLIYRDDPATIQAKADAECPHDSISLNEQKIILAAFDRLRNEQEGSNRSPDPKRE